MREFYVNKGEPKGISDDIKVEVSYYKNGFPVKSAN